MKKSALLVGALALGMGAVSATAGTIPVFNDLGDPTYATSGESMRTNGPLGASFTAVSGYSIAALTLRLDCDNSAGTLTACGTASYGNATAVSSGNGTNTLTLSNVTGVHIGDFIEANAGNGTTGLGANLVYVTGISGNTVTLSAPVSLSNLSHPIQVKFADMGSFTVNLFDSASGTISGTGNGTTSLPGTLISSFTVYDAALMLGNAGIPTGPTDVTWVNPFGSTLLGAGQYWIQLSDLGATGGPPHTNVEWDFVQGNAGTGVAGNFWTEDQYDSKTHCHAQGGFPSNSTPACGYLNGFAGSPVSAGVSFGMEVTQVPEPMSLVLLGSGLLGLGFGRRRKVV